MISLPTPEELRRLRRSAGLSQAELAKRAGVSQSLIARIESGSVNPTLATLRRILRALEEYVKEEVKAANVMHSPVITVYVDDGVEKVVSLMWKHAISQLPVLDHDGIVVGMVYEKDVVRAFLKHREKALKMAAKDFMSEPPPIISPSTPLSTVSTLIGDRYPAILVAEGRKLVGIITRSDLMKYLLTTFKTPAKTRSRPRV